jgi:hypothetical protein
MALEWYSPCVSDTPCYAYTNVHAYAVSYNTQLLYKLRRLGLEQHQWVPVHTGHQTQADGSPYRLCDLPLVLWPQTRVLGVLYPAHFCHVLGHDCEVLRASADDPHPNYIA